MELVKYDLAIAHINDLKALRNPACNYGQGEGLWKTLAAWLKSFKKPSRKVSAAYRAELLRQEWVVSGDPQTLKQTNC